MQSGGLQVIAKPEVNLLTELVLLVTQRVVRN